MWSRWWSEVVGVTIPTIKQQAGFLACLRQRTCFALQALLNTVETGLATCVPVSSPWHFVSAGIRALQGAEASTLFLLLKRQLRGPSQAQ